MEAETENVRSWSLPPGLPRLIGRKQVDWSCFDFGTHVPVAYARRFFQANGEALPKGESRRCILIHDRRRFEAELRNVDVAGRAADAVRLVFASNKELLEHLRQHFSHSYERIRAERQRRLAQGEKRANVVLDDHEAEYIDFLETGRPYEYEMRFLTRESPGDGNALQASIQEFMSTYVDAREHSRFHGEHPVLGLMDRIVEHIRKLPTVRNRNHLQVLGSVGKGNWTYTPWVVILDRRLTTAVQEGLYVAIIFAADMSRLYVGLQQAVTQHRSEGQRQRARLALVRESERLRQHPAFTGLDGFDSGPVDLAVRGGVGVDYQHAFIYHRSYSRDAVPDSETWNKLLETLLDRYQRYVEAQVGAGAAGKTAASDDPGPDPMTLRELLDALHDRVTAAGFRYPREDFEAFCIALKSKPFVILAGVSGTGKTQLPIQLARALGSEAEVIPVRPDWADSSDLLGYVDIHGRFRPGRFLENCRRAGDEPDRPFFVCLDEMNLARVEQYFAEVLSAVERRELVDGRLQTAPLLGIPVERGGQDTIAWDQVRWPDNLFLIGTVNMDETTHPFSRKVLDRAHTLEFRQIDLSHSQDLSAVSDDNDAGQAAEEGQRLRAGAASPSKPLNWRLLRPSAVRLQDVYHHNPELFDWVIEQLTRLNRHLQEGLFHVAYRVRDEVCIFVHHAVEAGWPRERALDYQVCMKILPRVQGSSAVVGRVLAGLWNWAVPSRPVSFDELDSGEADLAVPTDAAYPRTADRIALMLTRLRYDGYTSYWV